MIPAATSGAEAVLLALLVLLSRRIPSSRGPAIAIATSVAYGMAYAFVAARWVLHAPRPYTGGTRVLFHAFQGFYLLSIASLLAAALSVSGLSLGRAWRIAGGAAFAVFVAMIALTGHVRSVSIYPFCVAGAHGVGLTMLARHTRGHPGAWSGPDGVSRMTVVGLAVTALAGLLLPLIGTPSEALIRFTLFLATYVVLIAACGLTLARVPSPVVEHPGSLVANTAAPWRDLSPVTSTAEGFAATSTSDLAEVALDFPDVHAVFRKRHPAAWDDFATRVAPRHPAFAQALDDVYFHVRMLPVDRAQALLRNAWEVWVRHAAPPEGAALTAVAGGASNVSTALRVFEAVGQLQGGDALMVLQMGWMMLGDPSHDPGARAN